MPRKRASIGMHIVTNGQAVRGPVPLDEFVERVRAAAAKKAKDGRKRGPVENLKQGDATGLWAQPIPPGRQCEFKHTRGDKAGKRCGSWAMRGAKRCCKHGGYRQSPEHPATVRRLADVEALATNKALRPTIRAADPQHVQHIKDMLTHRGLPLSTPAIAEGLQALTTDDNGKALRRWLNNLTAPTQEPRANKPQKRR